MCYYKTIKQLVNVIKINIFLIYLLTAFLIQKKIESWKPKLVLWKINISFISLPLLLWEKKSFFFLLGNLEL